MSSEPSKKRSVLGPRESHCSLETISEEICFEICKSLVGVTYFTSRSFFVNFILQLLGDYKQITLDKSLTQKTNSKLVERKAYIYISCLDEFKLN